LRISIRGFGTRAAFGVRGIRLIIDGVPETTPDGQSQLDNLELNNISNIQILRGLSAGLYGNASGGVILINSPALVKEKFIETDFVYGSFNTLSTSLKSGFKIKSSSLILNTRYFKSDGYREHASSELFSIGLSLLSYLKSDWKLRIQFNHTNSPEAFDPGGVTLESVEEERSQARDRNIDFNAGESIQHSKVSARIQRTGKASTISSSVFYHKRKFEGRLPFGFGGAIDLDRNFFGNSSSYEISKKHNSYKNRILLGYDIHIQQDDRKRFVNNEGVKGDLTLDQKESFTNLGVFLIDYLDVKDLQFSLESRDDLNRISFDDYFTAGSDNSANIDYNSLSYSLGISYTKFKSALPFLKLSSNFETPTLSELSADPNGTGFNAELKASTSRSIEFGAKSKSDQQVSWQANLFFILSSNEILPYEIEQFPGRDFFRNAGATNRIGLETHLKYQKSNDQQVAISYTFSDFKFTDYLINSQDLSDNFLPGIPQHRISLKLEQKIYDRYTFNFEHTLNSQLYADNQNLVLVERYAHSKLSMSCDLQIENTEITFNGGINNLFDQEYFDNIRINAFGGRYYEAAAGRNGYLGVRVRL